MIIAILLRIVHARVAREDASILMDTDPAAIVNSLAETVMRDVVQSAIFGSEIRAILPPEAHAMWDKQEHKDRLIAALKTHLLAPESKTQEANTESVEKTEASATASAASSTTYKYAPYDGYRPINNWSDLYHYYPQLGRKIRQWKLEFAHVMRRNRHEFEGCANPSALADWIIPDVDDIRKDDRKRGRNLHRNYHTAHLL